MEVFLIQACFSFNLKSDALVHLCLVHQGSYLHSIIILFFFCTHIRQVFRITVMYCTK